MALRKTNWTTGFEQVPNALIEQASFRATGLWAFLAKLPDGWDFSVRGIAAIRSEGIDVIRTAVQELEQLGYLKREQGRSKGGKMASGDWLISRTPLQEKPTTAEPTTAEPTTENQTQQHTTQRTNNTKNIPKELNATCYALADLLHQSIIDRYPNNKIASNWRENWAKEIDKMNRIDGRDFNAIGACIFWAFNVSDFWHRQIWSGANLRKHFDKMQAQAQADMPKIIAEKKAKLGRDLAMDNITLEQYEAEMAKLG